MRNATTGAVLLLFLGCSSPGSSTSADGTCHDFNGTLQIDWGDCPSGPPGCNGSQSGCSVTFACETGTVHGSVSGETVHWTEQSGAACSVTMNGNQGTGHCSLSGQSCTFSVTQ